MLSGMPAQFMRHEPLRRRRLLVWIARATSSLPVPLSPVISTGMSLAATCRAVCTTLPHGRGAADDALEPAGLVDLLLKHLVLPLQRGLLRRAVDLRAEVVEVQRLLDEAVRALVHRLHGRRHVAVRRDEDDWRRRVELARFVRAAPARRAGLPSRGR